MAQRIVKTEGKNFVIYTDGVMRVDRVRLSYPHLFHPYKGPTDEGVAKYGCVGLLPKATHREAMQAFAKEMDALLESNKQKSGKQFPADKKCFRDGDTAGKDGYEGNWSLSTRESRKPTVRDKAKKPITEENADKIYAGCYVNILFRLWYQPDKGFGKRVNANLIAVQFADKGEPFGESRISEEDIDDSFDGDDSGGFEDDSGGDDDGF
jgi:hypothetical protein